MNLTDEERKLLVQFRDSRADQKLNLWLVEIIPPLVGLGLWFFTSKNIYLFALVLGYVFFGLKSRLYQNKRIGLFRSISKKVLSNEKET